MRLIVVSAALLLAACSGSYPAAGPGDNGPPPAGSKGDDTATPPATSTPPPTSNEPEDSGLEPPKYDVGWVGADECDGQEDGFYCEDNDTAYECAAGTISGTFDCKPGVCVEQIGCVACVEGQARCKGPRVLECETTGDAHWVEIEVCDPSANEACDVGLRTCVPLAPIGGTDPTGTYYQYSTFDATVDGFSSVSDADSWGDAIYFVADRGGQVVVAKYTVEILDSDGDGVKEPNQHPDNPYDPGPIEERVFTYHEFYPITNPTFFGPNTMELYVLADRYYYGGNQISEYVFDTEETSQFAPRPSFATNGLALTSFLGYSDVWKEWFSGNEGARRVIRYDDETSPT